MLKRRDPVADPGHQRRVFNIRLLVMALFGALLFGGAVFRLVELQVVDHHDYAQAARDNRIRITPVAPPRGLIYSRNGQLLAENVPSYNLVMVPDDVKDLHKTVTALTSLLHITHDELHRFHLSLRSSPPYRAVPLLTQMTPRQLARFAVERYRFPGVRVQARLVRRYPYGPLTVDSVGYVGRINAKELGQLNADNYAGTDYFGKTWLEGAFESRLHGKVGYRVYRADAAGRPLATLKYHLPTPGSDLVLTLDKGLQQVAQKAMKGKQGAVVVMNPRDGAILALVSSPSFNPNAFVNGISESKYRALLDNPAKPLWNRALEAGYAPGSTIKPYIALGALNDGVVTPSQQIFAGPYFIIPNDPTKHRFWDWTPNGHGWTDLEKAIEQSVDTYFYPVALKMRIARIDKTLAQFGLGSDPLPDLSGVVSGLLPTPNWKRRVMGQPWYPGDTVVMGIGQGYLQVSPLQLAKAVSIIAMRGHGYAPHLIRAWYDPETHRFHPMKPKPLPIVHLKNPRFWSDVIAGMHEVTASPQGTAYASFSGFPYPVAGKTGTAQLFSNNPSTNPFKRRAKVPYNLRDNNLFESFTPVDHPQLTVVVVVEHTGVRIGAASRVARKVMTYWYAHRDQIAQPLKQLTLHSQAPHKSIEPESAVTKVSHPPGKRLVVVVRSGDTLWHLTHQYRVSAKELARWNPGFNVKRPLAIGQKLVIWMRYPAPKDAAVSGTRPDGQG